MPRTMKAEARGAQECGSRRARRMRRDGKLPAVIYGAGKGTRTVALDMAEARDALHAGDRVVNVAIGGETVQALIKDVRYDALGADVLHMDLHELVAGATVKVEVSILVRGTPKGAAEGGVANQVLHELKIECLPADIPESVKVDVSEMKLGDMIHVKDLPLPKGVKVDMDSEAAVVICQMPHVEKEPEPGEAEAPVEPEVITAKKEEPEAEEGAEEKKGREERKPKEEKKE